MKQNAFSLIELLVVVAIIAILAAVAVPMYRIYAARVKVGLAYTRLTELAAKLSLSYQSSGSWPTSITFSGVGTISASQWTPVPALNSQGLYEIAWSTTSSSSAAQNQSIYLYATATGLTGVSSIVQDAATNPSCNTGNGGCNNVLYMLVTGIGGNVTKTLCGVGANNTYGLPLQYQPSNCQCSNLDNYWLAVYNNTAIPSSC